MYSQTNADGSRKEIALGWPAVFDLGRPRAVPSLSSEDAMSNDVVRRLQLLLIAAASCLACACASTPQTGSEVRSAPVQVYTTNPYVGKPYEVLAPLWVGSWRSALRLPTYPTQDEAIAALQAEAAKLNADALISVSCLDEGTSTWFKSNEPGFLCYGVAIRVGRTQG